MIFFQKQLQKLQENSRNYFFGGVKFLCTVEVGSQYISMFIIIIFHPYSDNSQIWLNWLYGSWSLPQLHHPKKNTHTLRFHSSGFFLFKYEIKVEQVFFCFVLGSFLIWCVGTWNWWFPIGNVSIIKYEIGCWKQACVEPSISPFEQFLFIRLMAFLTTFWKPRNPRCKRMFNGHLINALHGSKIFKIGFLKINK